MIRQPVHVFPPGEFIREELCAREWTQQDLANITGRTLATINQIIMGVRQITAEMASDLGAAFGTGPEYWMNLQSQYQLSKTTASPEVQERSRVFRYAPIKEMQKRKWLPQTTDVNELKNSLLHFFNVDSLDKKPNLAMSFRQSSGNVDMSHVAWACRSLQVAKLQPAKQYENKRFLDLIKSLKTLAAHTEEIRRVPTILGEYGIRYVAVQHLRGTRADGVALWMDEHKPVIAMSLRIGNIGNFWFTLFHELSHICHRDEPQVDVSLDKAKSENQEDQIESRANGDAANWLIPEDAINSFILRKRPYFYKKAIIQFAHRFGVHPGIVVGQLQFMGAIDYTHSHNLVVAVRELVKESAVIDGWGHSASV